MEGSPLCLHRLHECLCVRESFLVWTVQEKLKWENTVEGQRWRNDFCSSSADSVLCEVCRPLLSSVINQIWEKKPRQLSICHRSLSLITSSRSKTMLCITLSTERVFKSAVLILGCIAIAVSVVGLNTHCLWVDHEYLYSPHHTMWFTRVGQCPAIIFPSNHRLN